MFKQTLGFMSIPGAILATLLASAVSAQESSADAAEVKAAIAVQAQHQEALMTQPGVHGIGVGRMEDSGPVGIKLFVKPGTPKSALPAQLNGVPVEVVESRGFVAHVPHTGTFPKPVPMGVSTGIANGAFVGTLGYRVRRIGSAADVGYITNNHVAAGSGSNFCPVQVNPSAVAGFYTIQCQPGGACGTTRRIGRLVQVIPLVMGNNFLNTVDTAFVKSNRGCASRNIQGIGTPSGTVEFPTLGSIVKMSGRTSGVITNRITSINATVTVGYDACGSARFVTQAIASPVDSSAASLPGDSGSPVVRISGTSKIPVGLNFAGDGFIGVVNPIPLVLNALGVQIDTAADSPPAASCF